jgi:hypothetical protein
VPLGKSARENGAVLVVGTKKKKKRKGRKETPKQRKDVASIDVERRKR